MRHAGDVVSAIFTGWSTMPEDQPPAATRRIGATGANPAWGDEVMRDGDDGQEIEKLGRPLV
jgi:hypothetical protein